MDEYTASYSCVEKLIDAAQSIKESLICRICLELFKEPVTIKCGHKFCRSCILRVTNNEQSTCPFCNIKIQKRSVPKEGNELLNLCVKKFTALTEAIYADSGINVLQSCNKVKDTRESSAFGGEPTTSKIEQSSITPKENLSIITQKSTKSKANSQNYKKLSKNKKELDKASKNKNENTLDNYLSNKSIIASDSIAYQEKVESWLKNITTNADIETTDSNFKNDSINMKKLDNNTHKKLLVTQVLNNQVSSSSKTCSSTGATNELKINSSEQIHTANEEMKYKKSQTKIQEFEKSVNRKKSNILDKTTLKTPSSVPAASHSNACDWRRVKRVGKEMQVKTFKSLNVSKEKCSSLALLDDTVPCDSTNNDSKNIAEESINNILYNDNFIVEEKKRNLIDIVNNFKQKKNLNKTENNNCKDCSSNSSDSHKMEKILSHMDQQKIKEVIGILPLQNDSVTPEKTRCLSSEESTSKLNQLSPLEASNNLCQESSSNESSNFEKATTIILHNLPTAKRRLSLKAKLKANSSKSFRSQPNTSDNKSETESETQNNLTPERPRSRLSLRTPINKNIEFTLNKAKSPLKNCNENEQVSDNLKSPVQSQKFEKLHLSLNKPPIKFIKLGKINKSRRHVPFLLLGKMKSKDRKNSKSSHLIIKRNIPVNIDFKFSQVTSKNSKTESDFASETLPVCKANKILPPEKKSSMSCVESLKGHLSVKEKLEKDINNDVFISDESNRSNIPMEIDESIPVINDIINCQLALEEKEININKINETRVQENYHVRPEDTFQKCKEIQNVADDEKCEKSFEQSIKTKNDYGNVPNNNKEELELSAKVKESVHCDDSSIQENNKNPYLINKETNKIQEDVISISSNESELKNSETDSTNKMTDSDINLHVRKKNKYIETDSNPDSEYSFVKELINPKISNKSKSISTNISSSSSSPLRISPLKKKRTHSESSNEDDDIVSSIIGKWCAPIEEPAYKKLKANSDVESFNSNQSKSKLNNMEESISEENDTTIIDNICYKIEVNNVQRDPPIDDIINKVKSFKNNDHSNKLIGMPSSVLSADLFESNEQCIQPSAQITDKQLNNKTSDHSLSSNNVSNEKINLNKSENSTDVTIVDSTQFNKKNSNIAEDLNSSNKEKKNNVLNQSYSNVLPKSDVKIEENEAQYFQNKISNENIKNNDLVDQFDSYYVPDSLMNITQEQIAMKNIEKELFGADLSTILNTNNDDNKKNKLTTPKKKTKCSEVGNPIDDADFDVDNINATPVAKKRQIYNFATLKAEISQKDACNIFSPEKNINLIPAVTPMRNTKSYPLSHSTPMINVKSPEKTYSTKSKNITLVCSGLHPENMTVVEKFTKTFKARFLNTFSQEVTHVIICVDPETKVGLKTFKYIQGIAYKKYVISFQWVLDCLEQNTLLNEDENKYDVLDPDILESGSKKSRIRTEDLFKDFIFFCLGPFNSVPLDDFKNVLLYNGATVVSTIEDLSSQKDKYKVTIIETDSLSKNILCKLKKSESALVTFEWIVDSISQYRILPLSSYLCDMTIEEVLSFGFPLEHVAEEDIEEEEEEEDEELQ